MRPKITDVAQMANVSITTVSRVLNKSAPVNAETRKKVLAAIKKLEYYPLSAAQNLSKKHTRRIAVVMPYSTEFVFSNTYSTMVLAGVAEAISSQGYRLLLQLGDSSPETLRRMYYEGHADGLIIANIRVDDPSLQDLVDSKIPAVLLNRCDHSFELSYIDANNIEGAA
jgi:DNA-binding LacI/PurR family transcriptional regulator